MSYKQGHDNQGSYTDNIRVKISERYKPPHRINLPMTYSQRLNLNKQILDSLPKYEFALEKTVIEKMKDLRSARANLQAERKARLDIAKAEIKKKEEEKVEQEDPDVQSVEETVITSVSTPMYGSQSYSTSSSILMPTQATTNAYSGILTPMQLTNQTNTSNNKPNPVDKSPFNISDFEDDTSSPFDNMELKSINDLEELAQVLKKDETSSHSTFPTQSTSQMQPSFSSTYSNNQYSYIPNMWPMSQPTATANYSLTNGYYYHESNGLYQQQPYYYNTKQDNIYANNLQPTTKSNCKSVPDIMNALETELNNAHVTEITNNAAMEPARPKSTEIVYPKARLKPQNPEDALSLLPKTDQDLCKSICSMGFPIERVARTCKLVGSDQKKIVDHLLALSDLLDLGFSEKDVSSALLQCNNDRDKALDKLIS